MDPYAARGQSKPVVLELEAVQALAPPACGTPPSSRVFLVTERVSAMTHPPVRPAAPRRALKPAPPAAALRTAGYNKGPTGELAKWKLKIQIR